MSLRYVLAAVVLMAVPLSTTQVSADAYVSPEPSNITHLVFEYCAPDGSRTALARRQRENARWSLEYARATHERRWAELPPDLRVRANRIIDERRCDS